MPAREQNQTKATSAAVLMRPQRVAVAHPLPRGAVDDSPLRLGLAAAGYLTAHQSEVATEIRGGYREGNDVTAPGNDAPVDERARRENSPDTPANHSDGENVPEGSASSDDSQKSPAEQAVENQERALKTGEELPG